MTPYFHFDPSTYIIRVHSETHTSTHRIHPSGTPLTVTREQTCPFTVLIPLGIPVTYIPEVTLSA